MTKLILDISEYQGDVNFQTMKDAGADGVIARKQVGYYDDDRFFDNLNGAYAVGLPFGAYGVPFPGYDIPRQYEKFFEGIEPSDLNFPPFADVERKHSLTRSKAIGDVLEYTYALKDWWGDALFYTAKYVWQDYYSPKNGWIDDWELWVANYTTAPQPNYIPIGWEYRLDGTPVEKPDSYVIWQYSADGNSEGHKYGVSSRDVDKNRMDVDFFLRYTTPPPEETPPYKVELDVPKEAESIEILLSRV